MKAIDLPTLVHTLQTKLHELPDAAHVEFAATTTKDVAAFAGSALEALPALLAVAESFITLKSQIERATSSDPTTALKLLRELRGHNPSVTVRLSTSLPNLLS